MTSIKTLLALCIFSVALVSQPPQEKELRQGFTAITTAVYTLPDGTTDPNMPIGQHKQLTARSASGKTVEAMTIRDFMSKPGFHWRHISDPVTGEEITTVDPLHSRETLHRGKPSSPWVPTSSVLSQQAMRHCQTGGLKFLGYEYLLGVRFAHLVGENKVHIEESWAWEEEYCFIVQSRHEFKNPDGTIRA